jgi:hypothetical protein
MFGYHFNTLYKLCRAWLRAYSMTLTTKNIPDRQFGRHHVKKLRDDFSRLRKILAEQKDPNLRAKFNGRNPIQGGFYVVQATNEGEGWHLHLHVMYEGEYIDNRVLSALWKRITGDSYITWIKQAQNPYKAVEYLLADFSGKSRIRPEDGEIYNRIFKGSRLVQPFGKYRNVKLRVPFKCPQCGWVAWQTLDELIGPRARIWIEEGG